MSSCTMMKMSSPYVENAVALPVVVRNRQRHRDDRRHPAERPRPAALRALGDLVDLRRLHDDGAAMAGERERGGEAEREVGVGRRHGEREAARRSEEAGARAGVRGTRPTRVELAAPPSRPRPAPELMPRVARRDLRRRAPRWARSRGARRGVAAGAAARGPLPLEPPSKCTGSRARPRERAVLGGGADGELKAWRGLSLISETMKASPEFPGGVGNPRSPAR